MAQIYRTQKNVTSEARQKPRVVARPLHYLGSFEKYGRATRNFFKSGSSLCNFFQLPTLFIFSSTRSSQVKFCSHNSWSSIFIGIIMGEHHPQTSNKRAMLDTNTLFVMDSLTSGVETTGMKQSDTTFHSTPNALMYTLVLVMNLLPLFQVIHNSLGMLAKTSPSLNSIYVTLTHRWRLKRQTNGNAITVRGQKPILDNSIEKDLIA